MYTGRIIRWAFFFLESITAIANKTHTFGPRPIAHIHTAKFVDDGFIRLSAKPYGDHLIQIAVEDSGPGIPEEKKKLLFQKYQESLDLLSQGTVSNCNCHAYYKS